MCEYAQRLLQTKIEANPVFGDEVERCVGAMPDDAFHVVVDPKVILNLKKGNLGILQKHSKHTCVVYIKRLPSKAPPKKASKCSQAVISRIVNDVAKQPSNFPDIGTIFQGCYVEGFTLQALLPGMVCIDDSIPKLRIASHRWKRTTITLL